MDGEIEFLERLGDQLRRVAMEQSAMRGRWSTWLMRLPRIRSLPAMAATAVLALAGLTLWATIPSREGIRTQPPPGDGQNQPGPAAGMPAPPPTGEELRAVDASSPSDMWAVGNRYEDDTYLARSLILHFDGTTWSRVPSPDVGMLTDVAAASPTTAWAIADNKILRWTGSTWELAPHPGPPSAFFTSIDTSGPDDAWAVGMQYGAEWVDQYGDRNVGYDTFTMHWDGAAWTVVPSPNAAPRHNNVESVVSLSPTDAWVVGYSQEGSNPRTLTMHWDGTTWSLVPSPDPGSDFDVLWGIGTDGAGGIWAVGHYGDPDSHFMALYQRWTGTEWEVVVGPAGEATHQTPTALSGTSSDDAWAVGSEPTSSFLIARWDGAAWSAVDAELPLGGADSAALSDVVALSPSDAWAVGRYQGPPGQDGAAETFPLIEYWDGVAWEVVEVAPAGE